MEKNQICNICGKAFNSKYYLRTHISSVHEGIKNHKCDLCNKEFSLSCTLKKHIRIVHNHEKKACVICGKMLSLDFMKQHMLATHSVNNEKTILKCQICEKSFLQPHLLKKHMNTHTGIKPHKCKYCEKCFADASNKLSHEKSIHKGIKRSQKIKINSCDTLFI